MTVRSVMKTLRAALLFVACLAAASVSSGAQEPPPADEVAPKFIAWNQTLDRLSRELATLKLNGPRLDQIDGSIGQVTDEVAAFKGEIDPFADEARELREGYLASLQPGVPETRISRRKRNPSRSATASSKLGRARPISFSPGPDSCRTRSRPNVSTFW